MPTEIVASVEGFEAWRRAKFETNFGASGKMKRTSGGQVIGSRIQVFDLYGYF